MAISIPYSDSSPRSVYEAIFSGCCVAVTDLDWVHEMPLLMQSRCLKVNLNNQNWLSDAIHEAEKIVATPFKPSQEIYEIYDQESSMKKLSERIYC